MILVFLIFLEENNCKSITGTFIPVIKEVFLKLWLYNLCSPVWESQTVRSGGPYHQASTLAASSEKALRSMLEGESLEAFEQYSRAAGSASALEVAEYFELGFKLAFRLLREVSSGSESFAPGNFL